MGTNECLFWLAADALVVANTGRPFTRAGVIAACASHLGDKHRYVPVDNFPASDAGLVEAIRERELETYRNDPNRITSDFRGEDEIRRDYGGRAVWELLQNADDAMASPVVAPSELIGAKGIGFKSVLELSDEPEVFSDEFSLRFSARSTQELLRGEGLASDPPPMTFRIPHPRFTPTCVGTAPA
jgi:hypothetical protein